MNPADAKTLERVRLLLERAGHPGTPEEEARTSATLAARLIYAHGYMVSYPATAPPPPPPPPPPPTAAPPASSYAWKQRAKPYRVITSKFSGWCKACGDSFDEGDVVAWYRGRGCTHYDCRSFWDLPSSP